MNRFFFPLIAFVTIILFWEWYVSWAEVPKFVLPAPSLIYQAVIDNYHDLLISASATLFVTVKALTAAVLSGVILALLFSMSRRFEMTLYPFAVILQVTPIIAVAPLVVIWVGIDNVDLAQIIIAWLVAFFPILANMSAGLKAADQNLQDLFTLYGANFWQRFWLLLWPSAMPYLLASLKISGGLALIGGVVAEFVAGSGGSSGLAWRIIEAGNRLQIEKMFAGLFLLAVMGMGIFYFFSFLEKLWQKRSGMYIAPK